jgi:uncharacterized protein
MKLYVVEPGSHWMTQLFEPLLGHEYWIGRLTPVEVAAALFRRVRAGTLISAEAMQAVADLRYDVDQTYQILDVTSALADEAVDLARRFGLRGYDCIQLAGALEMQRRRRAAGLGPMTLVSADQELNAAARAEGITVEDPNGYP